MTLQYAMQITMNQRNILVTLECFVQKDGKYLMLHRKAGKRIMPNVWMAPGGKREFNEGLFVATRREILEETGLTIKNLRIKAVGNAYLKDLDQEVFLTSYSLIMQGERYISIQRMVSSSG